MNVRAFTALVAVLSVLIGAAPARAQDPPPDDPPPEPEPPGLVYYGFNDSSVGIWFNDYWRPVPGYPNRGLSIYENIPWQFRAGATSVRLAVDWRQIEATRDAYGWGHYARIYDFMVAFGIKPILTILYTPDWARDPDCDATAPACPPADTEDARVQLREFATKAVQRMPGAAAIEFWNEPNLGEYFWGNLPPDPEQYTHLLCEAHAGVKAAQPTMPVLTGGIAGTEGDNEKTMSLLFFLNSIYHHGGGDCFDHVGYHSYTGANDYGNEQTGHARKLRIVRNMLTYRGQTNKHIWMTEVGYSGMPEAKPEANIYDEQGQADALLRTYRYFSREPKVDAVIVHQLIEDTGIFNYEHAFSVLKRNDPQNDWVVRTKLAYCALAVDRRGTCDPAPTTALPPPPVCADARDNDGDDLTDHPDDPGCASRQGISEEDPPG